MRLPLVVFLSVLGLGGCGEKYSDSLQPLAETAWTERVSGLKCDHQMTFYTDGKYLEAMICTVPDYSQRAEVNKGTYHVNGPTLTVALNESTCSANLSGSVDFAYNGDTLTLYPSGGLITLVRTAFTPGEPGATIPLGCFDPETWEFTPGDLHSLE
jgi:hypothetical protein